MPSCPDACVSSYYCDVSLLVESDTVLSSEVYIDTSGRLRDLAEIAF
jgi:hypothetical protein